ncbi:MAG: GcrA family cell cycle regulator [Pseudomonadota bacterium]
MDWTMEQIAELTRLWKEGLTTSEIGKRLGISKNAVVGKAHRLHLSARPSPIKHSGRPKLFRAALPTVAIQAQIALRSPPKRPVELSAHSCRWPIGDPGEPGFFFCGELALAGKPYCAEHAAMAYVKVKAKAGEAA